jgi:hypothetical protein
MTISLEKPANEPIRSDTGHTKNASLPGLRGRESNGLDQRYSPILITKD